MPLTKEIDPVPLSQDLPLELRRSLSSLQSNDPTSSAMVSGMIDGPHDVESICPSYMVQQNLVMPAYPFRAPSHPACDDRAAF